MGQKGINARELADRIGLSHGGVKNIFCGNARPSESVRRKIEQELGAYIWSLPDSQN